jgi:outer membrane receptor protein involved in Fe transport
VLIRSRPQLAGGGIFISFPLVLFAVAAIPSAVSAGEEDDARVVEIRAERVSGVEYVPSSLVTLVEAEDMGPGLVTTSMMARAAPAARVREFGGPGHQVTVGLRGAASHQTAVLLDGVPLPDPTGTGVDLSAIPAAFVDRMEVLRGAASLQAGSGALGGLVNLVTPSEKVEGFCGRLSAGSYNTWNGSAGAAFESGSGRFLLVASGLNTSGDFEYLDNRLTEHNPYDDEWRVRENNDVLRGGYLLKGSTRLVEDFELKLTHQLVGIERGVPGLLGFTSTRAREASWSGVFDLRGRLPLEESYLEMGANLLLTGQHFRDPLGELTGVPIDNRQEGRYLEVFTAGVFPLGRPHLLWTRLSFYKGDLSDDALEDPDRDCVSARGGAELAFLSDALKIVPGVGVEYFSDAGFQWAPALGMVAEVADRLFLRVNLARAYRVPNFAELYLQGGQTVGNPDLEPESAWSADTGIEWLGLEKWRLALSGFYSRYSDLIVFEPSSNFRYRPLNVGKADMGGLELEIGGEVADGLEISGHYTLLLTANRTGQPNREGKQLPGRPRHTAGVRAWGKWKRLLAEADLYYVSSNYYNQSNTKELASRLLLAAGVGVDAGGGVKVMLQAKNMLNDQVSDVRGLPLPGISLFITVGVSQGGRT